MGPCRSTQTQAGLFRPTQVSQERAARHLGPNCLHPPALRASRESSGWMGSTSGGCDLQNFHLCCFDLFVSGLSQVLTTQLSITAGQGGRAGRRVCPLPVERGCGSRSGGCWPPGDPGHSSAGLMFQLAPALQPLRWFGLRMSSPGLAGLGGGFVPVLGDCGPAGPSWHEAVGLLQPCPCLPRASCRTWTTTKALSLRNGQKRN